MAQSRVKMEGQLAEDFGTLILFLTEMAETKEGMGIFLKRINISWEEYEEIKEYLYDKYKVVTFI